MAAVEGEPLLSKTRLRVSGRPAWGLLVWGSSPVWRTSRVASKVREAHSPTLQSIRVVVLRSSASAQSACHAGISRARSCTRVRESPSSIAIVTELVIVTALAYATCRFETRSCGARARTSWTNSMPVDGERRGATAPTRAVVSCERRALLVRTQGAAIAVGCVAVSPF